MEIKRHTGIAGQYSLSTKTEHGTLTFVGSEYGGPVVMVSPSGAQTFVSDPGRFGDFGKPWVQRFMESA
jgi:hypothetical protein